MTTVLGFGVQLREYRRSVGVTQEELAERCGLSSRTIVALECGKVHRPRRATVALLADGLGLTGVSRQTFTGSARGAASHPHLPPARREALIYQLPPDVLDFVGRDIELGWLEEQLTGRVSALRTAAVCGPPGVGKTALAVHAGHRLRSSFPDGALYAHLGGFGDRVDPVRPLARFCRAVAGPGEPVPTDPDELIARYRTLLADRAMLVILDDAVDAGQVRPLLPGGARCAVLVTGRVRLFGPHMPLAVLPRADSIELLSRIVGADRIRREPAEGDQIAGYCGDLPLAVEAVAARLAARPTWRLATYAAGLADEAHRLDQLAAAGRDLRASVASSYGALPEPVRDALGRLGVAGAGEFNTAWLATLLDELEPTATVLAEQLVDAHFLEPVGDGTAHERRYRLPDLMRLFAAEQRMLSRN